MTETEGQPIPLAAVLTGGKARRMGRDKASSLLGGEPLAVHVMRVAGELARRVVCIGGQPTGLGPEVEIVPDRYPGADSMGGIATALEYAAETEGETAWVLVAGCDMPLLRPELLRELYRHAGDAVDAVVPRTDKGYEPLCALYRARAADAFARRAREGELRLRDAFQSVPLAEVGEGALRRADPRLLSFCNVNRPADIKWLETFWDPGKKAPRDGAKRP